MTLSSTRFWKVNASGKHVRRRPAVYFRGAVVGALALSAGASRSLAHAGAPDVPADWWRLWSWEPEVVATLFLTGALYVSGLHALRRGTGVSDKLQREAYCYACGWVLLCTALVSPLHPWGSLLFSAHMTQHELLMVAAAPLIVLGRPTIVLLSALPGDSARRIVIAARRAGGAHVWDWLTRPFVAWLVHALALWIWHVPVLFEATLVSDVVHGFQHASFLGTALLFWHAVFYGPRRRAGYGLAVIYLFTTALHSGALGALLTFARHSWYPIYAARAESVGITAVADQQLGGLIMWIPAGLVYVVAGLALFAGWLRRSEGGRQVTVLAKSSQSCAPLS